MASPQATGLPPQTASEADTEQWLHMYEQMSKIRAFEETANELYTSARMPGLTHLYIGEEAIAVGVCEALRKDDYITSTHRGHGHCVAKGAALDRMFAELLGKAAGYCRGKGGSMHIADQDTGNLGANAIVGGSAGHRHGRGAVHQDARDRSGGGLFLWRRRAGPGAALRGDEHGAAMEAARDLRLREQPVQRIHPQHGDRGRHAAGRGPRPLASLPRKSMARTCARCYAATTQAGGAGAAWRRASLSAVPHLSLPRPPCRRYRP